MKRLLEFKIVANVTFVIVLVASIVFIFGFGSTIYLARQEIGREAEQKMDQAVRLVQTYVDDQLQRVEDVGYTLLSNNFAGTVRGADGKGFVTIDPNNHVIPNENEIFSLLDHLLNANPHVCGVAIGFEPGIYPQAEGEYGFAAYVTNVSGHNEYLRLGDIHDYRQKEWYKEAASQNRAYWSRPFAETSQGKVVACFSIPLHGIGDRQIGVLALDIDTDSFRKKCDEVTPIAGAEVALVDREFNVISHPDSANILKNIKDVEQYSSYQMDDSIRNKLINHEEGSSVVNKGTKREAVFQFAPIERTGWMISIECPKDSIYKGVQRMKRDTSIIAAISMLFILLCFWLLFRRVQSITVSKASIERDLEIASAIQKGMLPKLYPAFPGRDDIDVYGFQQPARTIGGDLYDYFIRDSKLYFCIGDVSGKGVPASLFMAVIRALFRNVSLHTDDPAEILSSLNTAIAEGNTHSMFCTMFLGVLNLADGHLEYCNAGHNAPVVRRVHDNDVNVFYAKPKTNIAVGVFEGFKYEKEETVLNPGDAVFLYTDGVTEAENMEKQLFGEEATLKALSYARQHNASTAKDFVDAVYDQVKLYAGDAEQSDDITMVVVEYRGQQRGKGSMDTLHLKNNINEVPSLSEWLEAIGTEAEIPADKMFQLNLALEEAVVNVMNYAYPGQEDMPVDISCTLEDGSITFLVDDHGIPFDPTAVSAPDITLPAEERAIGGLGIHLVRQIMDEVSYRRVGEHNQLTMTMKL